MAKVNFYLDKPSAKTDTQIYLFFSYSGKRLRFYTGQKINPKKWDKRKQRAKGIGNAYHVELNLLLDDLENTTKANYIKLLRADSSITKAKLFKPLSGIIGKGKTTRFNFITYIDFLLEKLKTEKEKAKKLDPKIYKKAANRLKGFKSRTKIIKEFSKNRPHEFDDIDVRFVLAFKDLLIENDFSNNYAHKIIATFKAILNRAIDEQLTKNIEWKTKRFSIAEESVHNIYFNVDQLTHLYYFKFEKKHIEQTRDSFLINCFTGLRFSDGVELHQDKIIERDGHYLFSVITQKTNERVFIPMHPMVKKILDKYDWKLPPAVAAQTMNRNLKTMAEEAEFNQPVYKTITKGGKRIEKVYKTFQLISTHTARRSLATNLHLAGVAPKSAMLVTGHKTVKQYMDYIKITSEQNAKILSKSDFFNMKLKRV